MSWESLILFLLIILSGIGFYYSRKNENFVDANNTIKHQMMEQITYERKKASLKEMKRDGEIDDDEFNKMNEEISKDLKK